MTDPEILIAKPRGETELKALAKLGNLDLAQRGIKDWEWAVVLDCLRLTEKRGG